MPNTLAHFGGQGPLVRLLGVPVDAKWVLLGCVLPDVPWIARRGVMTLAGGAVDPIGLRLYAVVQASLVFSVLLAGAAALLSARPRPVFAVLALGALLHLLWDAAQTKWGNGVHLLAPVSWEAVNVGWFWPESWVTVVLTLAGVAYVGREWRRGEDERVRVSPSRMGMAGAVLLVALYLSTPPLFFRDVLDSGSHSLGVLAREGDRTGRRVELDRARFDPGRSGAGDAPTLVVTGGELEAAGRLPAEEGTVSIRGVFVGRRTVRVTDYHVHESGLRDLASYVGLGLLAAVWLRELGDGGGAGHA